MTENFIKTGHIEVSLFKERWCVSTFSTGTETIVSWWPAAARLMSTGTRRLRCSRGKNVGWSKSRRKSTSTCVQGTSQEFYTSKPAAVDRRTFVFDVNDCFFSWMNEIFCNIVFDWLGRQERLLLWTKRITNFPISAEMRYWRKKRQSLNSFQFYYVQLSGKIKKNIFTETSHSIEWGRRKTPMSYDNK